jgi:hypothetical protein
MGTPGLARRQARRLARLRPPENITRQVDAWSVHVIRAGQSYTGWFADAVWGGERKALVAAQRFRDHLLLRIDPDTRVRRVTPKGTHSKTGVVGVNLEPHVVEGRRYERYVAHWSDEDGQVRRRRFSVGRYGRERALAMAGEAREVGVARSHAARLARQREEARRRLRSGPPMPRQVRAPLSRKGISMANRRTRRG